MSLFTKSIKGGTMLEAEVAPKGKSAFERRYLTATGHSVSPGTPAEYQEQSNKWGTELRVYFNDRTLADWMEKMGAEVEERDAGYRSGEYRYRVNNNEIWWSLVENEGWRLGEN